MTLQALVFTLRYGVLAVLLTLSGLIFLYLGDQAQQAKPLHCGTVGPELPDIVLRDSTLQVQYQLGKKLFTNNCAACHARDMKTDLIGPALAGVEVRWEAYPREALYAWIRNSQSLVQKEHPRAVELWSKWQPVVMNSFPQLTDEEIEAMLAYIAFSSGDGMVADLASEPPVVE